MRTFFASILFSFSCLLFQGCKASERPERTHPLQTKDVVANKPPVGDDPNPPEPKPVTSPMDIMASDLQLALVKNADLSSGYASTLITKTKVSITDKASTKLVDQATEFLSSLLGVVQGDKLKIVDQSKVVAVIGAASLKVLKKLYVPDGGKLEAADFSDPALVKFVSDVASKAIAKQNKTLSLEAVGPLLKGIVAGLPLDSITPAQVSTVLGSLSAGVVIAGGKSLESVDLAKFVEEANKGLMLGAGSRTGAVAETLALQAQAVAQECLKAIAAQPNFEKTKFPAIVKSALKGAMAGSGSMSKYDAATAVMIAKALIQGVVNAIKALDPLNYISMANKIVSEGTAGVKEGALEISGLEPSALDSLHIDPNEILAQLSSK
ncbi:MAG: hypothetical protein H7318_18025 [Oligoflexus sp.]|nr:hypothetical protein [Oligoflexus sp.]